MNCPVCNKELSFKESVCGGCGQSLGTYRRAISASNRYYNEGLAKARTRELKGAADALRKSLRFNKRNIDARNLLGLVYYEMGQVIDALKEWVLSKNYQEENNAADRYMADVQRNQGKLESINQAVKKYNSALGYAKQGSYELAIMQLEKAVSINPAFVHASQLLALLYMQQGENKKAAKCLSRADRIDKNNPLTIKYKNALPGTFASSALAEVKERPRKLPETEITPKVFASGSYKEERFNFWPYLNLLIGVALGIVVVCYLIVPTAKKNITSQYETQFKQYSDELAAQSVNTADLKKKYSDLEKEKESLNQELEKLKEEGMDEKVYENFFSAINQYISGDKEAAAERLVKVKAGALESAAAKKVYNTIKEDTFKDVAEKLAEEGRVTYNSGKYEEAVEILKKALKMDAESTKAIYFLGRCYHRQGDYEKAKEYYTTIINNYPDTERAAEAERRMKEIANSGN